MELRGQIMEKKVLPCCKQTSLACDALWECGTGSKQAHNLNLPSGFKELCSASHEPEDMGAGKVGEPGGLCVWQ